MVLNFFNFERAGNLTRELHWSILIFSSDSSSSRPWISTSLRQFNKRTTLSFFKPDRQDNFLRFVQFDMVSSLRFSNCPNQLSGISVSHDLHSSKLSKFLKSARGDNSASELMFISFNVERAEGSG